MQNSEVIGLTGYSKVYLKNKGGEKDIEKQINTEFS